MYTQAELDARHRRDKAAAAYLRRLEYRKQSRRHSIVSACQCLIFSAFGLSLVWVAVSAMTDYTSTNNGPAVFAMLAALLAAGCAMIARDCYDAARADWEG